MKIWEEIKSFGVAIIIALLLRAFVIQSFHIPSGSMIPTLMIGDFILVDKITYHLRPPERGDVVVFHYPLDESTYFVKRIIGVPGDRIQEIRGVLYINGKPVREIPDGNLTYEEDKKFYTGRIFKELLPSVSHSIFGGHARKIFRKHLILKTNLNGTGNGDNTPLFIVPKGKYFMMGDNRNHSYDSRFWGFVDRKEIVGIARVIFFSIDTNHWRIRFKRIGKLIK